MKNQEKIRFIVYVAIYAALTLALDYVKEMLPFLNLPNGGSINIALIPVMIASFHLGVPGGCAVGLLWWAISSLMGFNPYFLNLAQYLLDYVIPSFIVGASSFLCFGGKKTIVKGEIGLFVVNVLRTLSIVLSGVYYWADGVAAGSAAAWTASLSYNVPYCVATYALLAVLLPVLFGRLIKNK